MIADVDTIVIGAGAAGLMAALELVRAGQRVVVLEARERVGGRILTRHAAVPLELGAEFVHGLPEITWRLLRQAGLSAEELCGTPYRWAPGVQPAVLHETATAQDSMEAMGRWFARQPPGTDLSFDRYLKIAGISGSEAENATQYVEGFNAADKRRIGVAALSRQQAAEDAIQTHRMFHLPAGYDALPHFLRDAFVAAGGDLRLSHPVREIEWRTGEVRVYGDEDAAPLSSRHVLIALPLGVLKADAVRFTPAVPRMRDMLKGLEMGPVLRIALLFRQAFWRDAAPGMLFLFSPSELVPTWWTSHPGPSPQITGWIGGATAISRAGSIRGPALIDAALSQLASTFHRTTRSLRSELVTGLVHDWMADPWARGAYSYACVGGVNASAELALPVDRTLFFAGEHTDTEGHWGTVHAALSSGLRAARAVINLA